MRFSIVCLLFHLLFALVFAKISPNSKINKMRAHPLYTGYCQSGESPIDLDSCNVKELPKLEWVGHSDDRPTGFILVNNGETVKILYSGDPPVLRGGPLSEDYILAEIHFHWGEGDTGSEHSFKGVFGGLEAHILHYKKSYGDVAEAKKHSDGLAVVGLLFTAEDAASTDLDSIANKLSQITAVDANTNLPSDTMVWLAGFMEEFDYYSYKGSLTAAPYSKIVNWIVLKKTAKVTKDQLAEFRKLQNKSGGFILQNRRGTQALGNREIVCPEKP